MISPLLSDIWPPKLGQQVYIEDLANWAAAGDVITIKSNNLDKTFLIPFSKSYVHQIWRPCWVSKKHHRSSHRRCSVKKMFLKVSQISPENTCVGVCFQYGLQTCNSIKKRLQHRCFPVKFAKFLRTPILKSIGSDCF